MQGNSSCSLPKDINTPAHSRTERLSGPLWRPIRPFRRRTLIGSYGTDNRSRTTNHRHNQVPHFVAVTENPVANHSV